MDGCQNYGPFFGYPKYKVPFYNRDPKRDHNFDNHPHLFAHGIFLALQALREETRAGPPTVLATARFFAQSGQGSTLRKGLGAKV